MTDDEKADLTNRMALAVHNDPEAAKNLSLSIIEDWPEESLDYGAIRMVGMASTAKLSRDEKIELIADRFSQELQSSSEAARSKILASQRSWSDESWDKHTAAIDVAPGLPTP